MAVNPVAVPVPQNSNMDRALFVWVPEGTDDPLSSDAKMQALLNFCSSNGVNVLFLDIWRYLGGANWTSAKVTSMKKFITAAHASGIRVMALAGNSDWPVNQSWVMTNIVKNLAQYNSMANDTTTSNDGGKFDGVMLDVEYWTVGGYDAQVQVPAFCDFMAAMRKVLDIPVGCFASQWQILDGSGQSVTYKSKTALEGVHLMDNSDFVCVACYSNNNNGTDGAVQITMFQPWYDYAKAEGRNFGLWCGSETIGPASGQTYYGKTKTVMEQNHTAISNAFRSTTNAAFRGQAVHDYKNYSAMSA